MRLSPAVLLTRGRAILGVGVALSLLSCFGEHSPAAHAGMGESPSRETSADDETLPHLHGGAGGAREAHSDHTPRHGGQFHMSSDRAYHLEGVLVDGQQFRLYLYDQYTDPIDAAGLFTEVRLEAVRLDADGEAMGSPEALPMRLDETDGYLVAALPPSLVLPVELVLELRFAQRSESDAFGFLFD